jgi:hypothetical protein
MNGKVNALNWFEIPASKWFRAKCINQVRTAPKYT